jgi:hypothetical protein
VREKRSKKRYVFATVGTLMLSNFLIEKRARRDSNSRPPGSKPGALSS